MAKVTIQEIIETLKEMTILEVNELVKAVEEEFGVSAAAVAAPVAAAPAPQAAPAPAAAPAGGETIKAPMPGLALRFNVKVGDKVNENDVLMVMEAMKMENEIYAPCAGTVTAICVNQGDQLQAGDTLMTIA